MFVIIVDFRPFGVQEGYPMWGSKKNECLCELSTVELQRLFVWSALHVAKMDLIAKTLVCATRSVSVSIKTP